MSTLEGAFRLAAVAAVVLSAVNVASALEDRRIAQVTNSGRQIVAAAQVRIHIAVLGIAVTSVFGVASSSMFVTAALVLYVSLSIALERAELSAFFRGIR